jgi:hypothetical protein
MAETARVVDVKEELARVRGDVTYFVQNYCFYQETRGKNKGTRRFTPWPWQLALLYNWQHGLEDKFYHVILKSRQLGVTWLACFYALWLAVTQEGTNVLILSYKEGAAKVLIRRLKIIFNRLPDWIKGDLKINNSTEVVEFRHGDSPEVFSRIEALPSTVDSGRSEATTLVILDEWAMHPYAEDNFSAITDSLGGEGAVIGISTAKGAAGTFANNFKAAISKSSEFIPWFIDWSQHPDRDQEWYDRTLRGKIASQGPDIGKRDMYQEHPRTWQEAFVSSGTQVFDTQILMQMVSVAADHPPINVIVEEGIREWVEPIIGRDYVIGVDCAEGLVDRDYSTAIVRDWRTGVHVATLRGRWDTREFGRRLATFAEKWNNAFVGVERNGPGLAVIDALANLGYSNIYFEVKRTSDNNVQVKEGWTTTKASKPLMVAEMQEALAASEMVTWDELLLGEYLSYVREDPREQDVKVSSKASRMGAQRGEYDDLVMADLICWQMRKYYERTAKVAEPYYSTETPSRADIEYMESVRSGGGLIAKQRKYGKLLPSVRYV